MTSERELRYRERQQERSQVRVTVWVHKSRAEELKEFAKKLREPSK